MKNTLGNSMMVILFSVFAVVIYTVEVEANFSSFQLKAFIKVLIYATIPFVVLYIVSRLAKKKE